MDHLAAAAAQEEREHDAGRGEGEHRDREHAEDEHRPGDVVVVPDVAIEEGSEVGHLEEERPVVGRRRDVGREAGDRSVGTAGRGQPGEHADPRRRPR